MYYNLNVFFNILYVVFDDVNVTELLIFAPYSYNCEMGIRCTKQFIHHLCGLVVRVPGYRSRGRGSIPGATRFSEWWVWKGVQSAS
jgi:hypothetical protein